MQDILWLAFSICMFIAGWWARRERDREKIAKLLALIDRMKLLIP